MQSLRIPRTKMLMFLTSIGLVLFLGLFYLEISLKENSLIHVFLETTVEAQSVNDEISELSGVWDSKILSRAQVSKLLNQPELPGVIEVSIEPQYHGRTAQRLLGLAGVDFVAYQEQIFPVLAGVVFGISWVKVIT